VRNLFRRYLNWLVVIFRKPVEQDEQPQQAEQPQPEPQQEPAPAASVEPVPLSAYQRDVLDWGKGVPLRPKKQRRQKGVPRPPRKEKATADESEQKPEPQPEPVKIAEPIDLDDFKRRHGIDCITDTFLKSEEKRFMYSTSDDLVNMGLNTIDDMKECCDKIWNAIDEALPFVDKKTHYSGFVSNDARTESSTVLTRGEFLGAANRGIYVRGDSAIIDPNSGIVHRLQDGTLPLGGLVAHVVPSRYDKDRPENCVDFHITYVNRVFCLPPGFVATGDGFPYRVTMIAWMDARKKGEKTGWAAIDHYVTVDREGKTSVCLMVKYSNRSVRRHGKRRRGEVMSRDLYLPCIHYYNPNRVRKDWEQTIEERTASTLNGYQHNDDTWNAVFEKHKRKLIFCFDYRLARRLFAERRSEVSSDGKRLPILHFVTGHRRKLADGSFHDVKIHIRGARRFKLGDYAVEIQVPGLHRESRDESGVLEHCAYAVVDSWFFFLFKTRNVSLVSRKKLRQISRERDLNSEAEYAGKVKDVQDIQNYLTYYRPGLEPLVGDQCKQWH